MPIRIKWNKYETALLIEAFWKVEENKKNKHKIIVELSKNLRKMAINAGVEIDDIYRNTNGISMQLGSIAHIFYPERPALTSSKLFEEMVLLYLNDNDAFNLILKEAKKRINCNDSQSVEKTTSCNRDYLDNELILKISNCDSLVRDTLLKHYEYGFNMNSPIELIRFRSFFKNDNGCECGFDDVLLLELIENCGIVFQGKLFVLTVQLLISIYNIFNDIIIQGYKIVYYELIFEKEFELFEKSNVVSYEHLKEILNSMFSKFKYKNKYCILNNDNSTELALVTSELNRVWGNCIIRKVNELKKDLPYIPVEKIKYALACSDDFVWDSLETYCNRALFSISDKKMSSINEIIKEKCTKEGSISFDELPLEDIYQEYYELSELAIQDLIYYPIKDLYSRNNKMIYFKNEVADLVSVFRKYCSDRVECKIKEFEDLMIKTTGNIRCSSVVELAGMFMVRVNKSLYVSDDRVNFQVDIIDGLLSKIIKGNGVGINEISIFSIFPDCGYAWNSFLLESYCQRFSMKYKYMCLTPSYKSAGVIVKKEYSRNYHSLMTEIVANSSVNLVINEVYDFMISTGLLVRRQYGEISKLIEDAKIMRERSN